MIKIVIIQECNPVISCQFHTDIAGFTHSQISGILVDFHNMPEFSQFSADLGGGMIVNYYDFGGRHGLRSNGI